MTTTTTTTCRLLSLRLLLDQVRLGSIIAILILSGDKCSVVAFTAPVATSISSTHYRLPFTTEAARGSLSPHRFYSSNATNSKMGPVKQKSTRLANSIHTDTDDVIEDGEDDRSLLSAWKNHDSVEFHYFSPEEASEIRATLLSWYQSNRRKLPWRGDAPPWDGSTAVGQGKTNHTKKQKGNSNNENSTDTATATTTAFDMTAYGIWVSEVMLQQTRVEAVIAYWVKWMQTFPTVNDLAAASPEQVNSLWAGLGFYRRARLLHQAAKVVVKEHDSVLPRTVPELMTLPGIGRYTASAIASIAYNVSVPVVDGNVCRVLARLRGIATHIKDPTFKDKVAWTLAEQIVDASSPVAETECDLQAGNVNQALMELGATFCSPSGTGTDPYDPLVEYYWSTRIAKQAAAAAVTAATAMASSSSSITTTTTTATANNGCCQVCGQGGFDQALETLQTLLEEDGHGKSDGLEEDEEDKTANKSSLGHKVFPLPPPKPVRREEVLAVAAISIAPKTTTAVEDESDVVVDNERWLLVKRPSTGLLAGQWEFPSACIWTSSGDHPKDKKKKKQTRDQHQEPPYFAVTPRRKALKSLLREIMTHKKETTGRQHAASTPLLVSSEDLGTKLRGTSNIHQASSSSKGDPLVHIFSHVRHTMWIEQVQVTDVDPEQQKQQSRIVMAWTDSTGRQARWMTRQEMQQVGVTSGVKKILAAVVNARARLGATKSDKSWQLTTRAAAISSRRSPKKRQRRR